MSLMLRHFVRPAGLLGVLGLLGLSQPTSPAMAVPKLEGGEGDGADNRFDCTLYQMKTSLGSPAMAVPKLEGGEGDGADNRLDCTMYQMKTSLGSSEGLRRGTIRSRPSWLLLQLKGEVLAEPESPSMAEEEGRGGEGDDVERLRRFKQREAIREQRECLDKLKKSNETIEAEMYYLKSRSLGSSKGWRSLEDALGREREIIHTWLGYLDEFQGLDDSLEAVIKKQMKTSTGSSYYHDLTQRQKELWQQRSVCLDNLDRIFDEAQRIFPEILIQMNEVLFEINLVKESTLL